MFKLLVLMIIPFNLIAQGSGNLYQELGVKNLRANRIIYDSDTSKRFQISLSTLDACGNVVESEEFHDSTEMASKWVFKIRYGDSCKIIYNHEYFASGLNQYQVDENAKFWFEKEQNHGDTVVVYRYDGDSVAQDFRKEFKVKAGPRDTQNPNVPALKKTVLYYTLDSIPRSKEEITFNHLNDKLCTAYYEIDLIYNNEDNWEQEDLNKSWKLSYKLMSKDSLAYDTRGGIIYKSFWREGYNAPSIERFLVEYDAQGKKVRNKYLDTRGRTFELYEYQYYDNGLLKKVNQSRGYNLKLWIETFFRYTFY